MDHRIKFRHLDAFSSIARAGSLKEAAEELHLSQPAISKTLKELEALVGAALMERDRSGAKLTQEGEVFLQFAEQCTAALRHGLHSVRSGGAAAAHLKVGALPSVASNLLPAAAAMFAKNSPDTLLEIHEGPHQDLTSRLRAGRLDLVVGRLGRPETMQGLSSGNSIPKRWWSWLPPKARPFPFASSTASMTTLSSTRPRIPPFARSWRAC